MNKLSTFTDKWEIQLRKGLLEFMILLSLMDKDQYGFELIDGLTHKANFNISEGTIYPLMMRIVKDGLVRAYWSEPSDNEPPRKYYTLTPHGRDAVAHMTTRWISVVRSLDILINEVVK